VTTDALGRVDSEIRTLWVSEAPPESELPSYPVPPEMLQYAACTFESGFAEWLVQAPLGRLFAETDFVAEGSYAGYAERRQGDLLVANGHRAEVSGASHPNAELAYGMRFMIPSESNTSNHWQFVYQWHSGSGSPPLAAFIEERLGAFALKLGHGDSKRTDWRVDGLPRDVWHSLFIRIQWSRASTGWQEAWLNGQWVDLGPLGPNGVPRKTYATNPTSDHTYLKGGIYRSSSATGTTKRYIDDIRAYELGPAG
jgi:Polysaccharide lyase